jgi:hypothetical protein
MFRFILEITKPHTSLNGDVVHALIQELVGERKCCDQVPSVLRIRHEFVT